MSARAEPLLVAAPNVFALDAICQAMAKPGSIVVASLALLLGIALAFGGILLMLDAGSFVSAEREQNDGILGVFGGSSESASVDTAPWIGLIVALLGGSLLLFGVRGLYVTFEGRGEP